MNTNYLMKTFNELINAYCFEHDRINKQDKEITQRLIKKEMRRRFEVMMKMLDSEELSNHPEQIYEYFTHEYTKKNERSENNGKK